MVVIHWGGCVAMPFPPLFSQICCIALTLGPSSCPRARYNLWVLCVLDPVATPLFSVHPWEHPKKVCRWPIFRALTRLRCLHSAPSFINIVTIFHELAIEFWTKNLFLSDIQRHSWPASEKSHNIMFPDLCRWLLFLSAIFGNLCIYCAEHLVGMVRLELVFQLQVFTYILSDNLPSVFFF